MLYLCQGMDERIKKVLDYIEDHLDKPLRLADLAVIACLSPSQFHRLFKKETQRTPFEWIEEIKMNKAYQLLVKEAALVQKLAVDLGYNDYETFSRAFKKHFFISPDDLKSITLSVEKNLRTSDQEELIVLSLDSMMDEKAIIGRLRKFIAEKEIALTALKQAKVFKISHKSGSDDEQKMLIKNKYEMREEERIWKALLNQ